MNEQKLYSKEFYDACTKAATETLFMPMDEGKETFLELMKKEGYNIDKDNVTISNKDGDVELELRTKLKITFLEGSNNG